jgi:hypothetical protein
MTNQVFLGLMTVVGLVTLYAWVKLAGGPGDGPGD